MPGSLGHSDRFKAISIGFLEQTGCRGTRGSDGPREVMWTYFGRQALGSLGKLQSALSA